MRVSLVRAGGFAGLTTTTAVESQALPPDQARELEERVARARVFDLPERTAAGPPQPDAMHYALTVEDGDRVHTVRVPEEALTAEVDELISFIDSVPDREESVDSPADPPD
jgi:hypothetical protein